MHFVSTTGEELLYIFGMTKRLAVVLCNLGGPDSPAAVQPFLQNLFSDPAILRVPAPVRWFLARLISRLRARKAQAIYAKLGGGSPLLPNTQAQAKVLEQSLQQTLPNTKVFIAMRYWHPFTKEAVEQIKSWNPDSVALVSLYPQFSTTTTASSFDEFTKEASRQGLIAPVHPVCCYPEDDAWTEAVAQTIQGSGVHLAHTRILFSAHGLPKKIVDAGDPYPLQVKASAKAVLEKLTTKPKDSVVCYQSKVGPMEWLKPSTEEEIQRAGREGIPILVVPIAFVSEHSETLVELDDEYRHLATLAKVPKYTRAPTVQTTPRFIEGLTKLIIQATQKPAEEYLCALKDTACFNPQGKCSRVNEDGLLPDANFPRLSAIKD